MDNNLLIHDDCLEYMKTIQDETIDLIVTDPPYLMDYKTNRRNEVPDKYSVDKVTEKHDFATSIHGDSNPTLISDYIKECYRIMKNDTAMYMFCNEVAIDFFIHELELLFTRKNIIIWVKNNHTAGDLTGSFGRKYENIILVNKGISKFRGKRITDVWEFNKVSGKNQLHQNQKPESLIKQCIEKHSDPGDIVFDGFVGSGTTAIAALATNRRYICVEKDVKYYNIAKNRISTSTNPTIIW